METDVLELQRLPETEIEAPLTPVMCCDTDWTSGECTEWQPRCR